MTLNEKVMNSKVRIKKVAFTEKPSLLGPDKTTRTNFVIDVYFEKDFLYKRPDGLFEGLGEVYTSAQVEKGITEGWILEFNY